MAYIHAHDSAARPGTEPMVLGALKRAAAKSGTSFSYLLATAQRESGLDPTARAKTSSASGLFQFIDQTWLGMIHRHGDKYGAGEAAAAITRGKDGRYTVADPGVRAEILALRDDPDLSAAMAGEYAGESRERLRDHLGREPSDGDLYAAHFLGAGGAVSLIKAREADPLGRAADRFPEAAAANRAIFFDQNGRARSLDEVYDRVTAAHGGDASGGTGEEDPAPSPHARLAHGAASDGGHGGRSGAYRPAPVRGLLLSPDMIAMMAALDPVRATARQSVSKA